MSLWTLVVFLLAFVSRGNAGECQKPEPENNVVLTADTILKNDFPDGSEVTLQCAVGYVKDQGSDTIRCVSGSWSKQELTCKKKDCGNPRLSPNIQYQINGTLFGARIKAVCDRGYRLQGSSHRQCLATGWSGKSQCLLITCGKLPEIPHAIKVNHLNKEILEFKEVIEYECEEKYTLVGNASVVCQGDGKYSSLPQCKGECQKPEPENNVVLTADTILKNDFPDGSEVTLKCAFGYMKDQGSDTIRCVSGSWSKQELTCKMITCGRLPEIPHAIKVNHLNKEILEFKEVIEYKCEEKYTLVGNASVVCQGDGKYSSFPQCKGECQKPEPENNVVLTADTILKNDFPDGSEVTLKCAVGYVKDEGSDTIRCVSGSWSKQELTCKKSDCGNPRSSPNMQYQIPNGTLFGARVIPVCDPGYRLQGSSHRQCLAIGWSGNSQCLLITCGKLPEIPHSTKVNHLNKEILEFKEVIEYKCEDKYTLVGNASVVCQGDGNYSSLPQCKGMPGRVAMVGFVSVFGVFCVCAGLGLLIAYIVKQSQKRNGSYNTGEEKRPKEPLMKENSDHHQYQHKGP